MNVLYVCPFPYPPDSGHKIASYNSLRFLAKNHSVHVAALAESKEELKFAAVLEQLGITLDAVVLPIWRRKLNVILALASGTPLSLAFYRSAELERKIIERCKKQPFDAVLGYCSSMGPYAEQLSELPLIADLVDLDSQKWKLFAEFSRGPRAWVYRLEAGRLLAYERALARRAYRILLSTHAEIEDCHRLIPEARGEIVSNGVDLEFFRPKGPKPETKNLVFTGVMNYLPNIRGVRFFCEEIFPLVIKEVPEATLTIVGSKPSTEVVQLGKIPGVLVTGWVPDVRPYLQGACAAVAPLQLARGIQNKVLEAMAMATPVVATTAATRGLDVRQGEGIVVVDEPSSFAIKTVELLEDRRKARALGEAGRKVVERRYTWERQLAPLDDLLQTLAHPRQAPSQLVENTCR